MQCIIQVWIYGSHLHLVPLLHVSPPSRDGHRRRFPNSKDTEDKDDNIGQLEDEDWITAQDALTLVRDPTVDTQAPSEVEQLVWQRISG
jgi:hypothetical protein